MKAIRAIAIGIILLMAVSGRARSQQSPAQAFKNVDIHLANGNTIESGTIVWRDGVIEAVGEGEAIRFDAYVRNGGESLHLYPGFIDGLACWGSAGSRVYKQERDASGNRAYERARS